MGVSANGCHHNISIWRGDENVFMPEGEDQQKPGQHGLWAIGGIMAHQPALTALTCPTVNSYRRLWDTGFWAPVSPTGATRTVRPRSASPPRAASSTEQSTLQ